MRTVKDFKCATYVKNESFSEDTLADLMGFVSIEKVPRKSASQD